MGSRGDQLHGLGIVTVGAAHRVDHFTAVLVPGAGEKFHFAVPGDQPGHIRRLAGPAGGRLGTLYAPGRIGRAGTQGDRLVFQHVVMTAGPAVILGKGIARPVDDHTRQFPQGVCEGVAFFGLHVGGVLAGIMPAPFGRAHLECFDFRRGGDSRLIRLVFPDGHGQKQHGHNGEHRYGRHNLIFLHIVPPGGYLMSCSRKLFWVAAKLRMRP